MRHQNQRSTAINPTPAWVSARNSQAAVTDLNMGAIRLAPSISSTTTTLVTRM